MVWSMSEALGIILWLVLIAFVVGAVIALLLSLWFWLKKRIIRKNIPIKLKQEVENAKQGERRRAEPGTIDEGELKIKAAVESRAASDDIQRPRSIKPNPDDRADRVDDRADGSEQEAGQDNKWNQPDRKFSKRKFNPI